MAAQLRGFYAPDRHGADLAEAYSDSTWPGKCSSIVLMDDLTPMSAEELESDIRLQIAAMRARKESGALRDVPQFFAKRLTERLLRSGLRPFRGPGAVTATADQFPGSRD